MVVASCAKCGASFEYIKVGRGRPRKHCDDCRRIDTRRRPKPLIEVLPHACLECATLLHTRAQYCSSSCKWVARKRKSGVPCQVCGEPTGWTAASGKVDITHKACSPTPCGAINTYKRHGCRCDECRLAWNESCRKYQTTVKMVRSCVECSADFNPRANQLTCSPVCRKTYLGRLGHNASRAEYFGVAFERFDRLEVFAACDWTCGICTLPVDPGLKFPDPGSPTLDHIVPMSLGGGHVRSNAQLAHFYCNTVKGAREDVAC